MEMLGNQSKRVKLKTGSTVFRQKQTHVEPMSETAKQENSVKQDEKGDGILEYDSSIDNDDIPSLEREAYFHLGRGFRFVRSIRFNSRIVSC